MSNKIHILGNNALSYALGAKFLNHGDNVQILSPRFTGSRKGIHKFTVKEKDVIVSVNEIRTDAFMHEEPDFLIITGATHQYKKDLTLISPQKLKNTTVLCLTPIFDNSLINGFINSFCISGFQNNIVLKKDNTILLPQGPLKFTIHNTSTNKNGIKKIKHLFEQTDLDAEFSNNFSHLFWEHFCPFAISYLNCLHQKRPVFENLQKKEQRDIIKKLCAEIHSLAVSQGCQMEYNQIIKKIYNIPAGTAYPLQNGLFLSEFNYICNTIFDTAHQNKIEIPFLRQYIQETQNTTNFSIK